MQGESTDGDRLMCGDHRNDWNVSREELIDALREAHQQVLELQAQRKEYHWLEEADDVSGFGKPSFPMPPL